METLIEMSTIFYTRNTRNTDCTAWHLIRRSRKVCAYKTYRETSIMCAINHETVIDRLAVDLVSIEMLEYGWIVCNVINETWNYRRCAEQNHRQMNDAAFLSCNSNWMFTQFR